MDFMTVVAIFVLAGLALISFARYRNRKDRKNREIEKEKFSQTVDGKAEEFVLLGHTNPFNDDYPAPVDAVGILGGVALVIVRAIEKRDGIPIIRQLRSGFPYHQHDAETTAKLEGFDYWNDFLFAYSEKEVIYQKSAWQEEFYGGLLKDREFCKNNPLMRLYLAMFLRAARFIIPELIATLKWQVIEGYPETLITDWYCNKFRVLVGKDTLEFLPQDWRHLLKKGNGD